LTPERGLVDQAALAALVAACAESPDVRVRQRLGRLLAETRPAPTARPWLDVSTAASALGVSERTVLRRCADGTLASRRLGGRLLIAAASVIAGQQRTGADTAPAPDAGVKLSPLLLPDRG
jgi:excisionase family DNA binding protein